MQMIYKANSCFDSNEIGCQQSDSRALQFQITMKETSTYKVIEMFSFLTRIELSHSDKSMFSHQTTILHHLFRSFFLMTVSQVSKTIIACPLKQIHN